MKENVYDAGSGEGWYTVEDWPEGDRIFVAGVATRSLLLSLKRSEAIALAECLSRAAYRLEGDPT